MSKIFNISLIACGLCMLHMSSDAATAARARTQSAIQSGTNVRTRVAPTTLYSQECYDAYYGCMDQFCILDNSSGGSCACSDENQTYEKKLDDIKKMFDDANNIKTVEVERIQAGAQADIIFSGTRQYDAAGNVIQVTAEKSAADVKAERRSALLSMWGTSNDDDDIFEDALDSIATKKGDALHRAADEMCREQMPASCSKDVTILYQVYATQIKSDCKGFENEVAKKTAEAEMELAAARSDVRQALSESLKEANKFDRGTCMVEFRKCMQTDDACGKDWTKCVSTIASENMQNQTTVSTAGTKVEHIAKYNITDSTMEILDSKRNICERVLNQCVAARDFVWPDFLREAAPTIRIAELAAESKMRQSCLTDISDCIQKACRDDIVGTGTATMDSCLSRPEMARSFCKVQVDSCERMEPMIWGYVVDKLAAMRVDACTDEVKSCFTSEDRCGPNFVKCIGMDYEYIHDICPLDKLVVCKKNNPNFAMSDLDSMLMGLYLNIDNSALENCQNLVDVKMAEICGSTTNCDVFATDDTIGTGSLRSQKDGDVYRVTGMISFGSIDLGNGVVVTGDDDNQEILPPGQIDIQDYLAEVRARNKQVPNSTAIIATIEEELNNISGKINRTIDILAQDTEIQYCISGRNLSQITGRNESTTGRFPTLLNQVKVQIAMSALRKANENYNKKLETAISQATKDASADLAQYMCQKIAENGLDSDDMGNIAASTPLSPPYAISYDVGAGLTLQDLVRGGQGVIQSGGMSYSSAITKDKDKSKSGVRIGLGGLKAGNKEKSKSKSNVLDMGGGGVITERTAIFNRETRNCHVCTTTSAESCSTKGHKGWFKDSRGLDCETIAGEPKCEDITL